MRISLASGDTVALTLPDDIEEWNRLKTDPGLQARVRGLLVVFNGHSYALCAPRAFRRVSYDVELIMDRDLAQGENVPPAAIRASYSADMVMASMTLYLKGDPPMVRFDVRQSGKMRWQAP